MSEQEVLVGVYNAMIVRFVNGSSVQFEAQQTRVLVFVRRRDDDAGPTNFAVPWDVWEQIVGEMARPDPTEPETAE